MAPLITAFVSDLMFQTRIESIAESLDMQVCWFENIDQVMKTDIEGLSALGTEYIIIDRLTRMGSKLIIFDLGNNAIPWTDWIPLLKTNPATRRIPVICFGSHVDIDTLKMARKVGSDEVLARSRFVTILSQLFKKHVEIIDLELIQKTCDEALHPEAVIGLKLFNNNDYFNAHEHLEEAWKDDISLGRDLYRGVLQVAVAYFQVERANFKGAVKMFQRARGWLDPLPDICRGINLANLRDNANAVYDEVLALGPDRLDEFPAENLKPIIWELN